jgi:preprotein translocase subunit SecD
MSNKGSNSAHFGIDRWNQREAGSAGSAKHARSSNRPKKHHEKMPAQVRRWVSTLVVLAAVCVACIIGFTPLSETITQGLDIKGGVSIILSASKSDGSQPSSDEMQAATTIVQNRVNSLGASEATVQQQGSNSILVQIPGATDAESAAHTIGQAGHLEFVRLDDIGDADALLKLRSGQREVALQPGSYTPFMDGSYIGSTSVQQTQNGQYVVNISFNSDGAQIFGDVTRELAPTHGQIAIVLDGTIESAPVVQSEITDGNVSISGNFSLDDARNLKTVLDSGSLPVNLTFSESRVVGPTLGQDSLTQGIVALVVGVALVVVYLFIFYRGLGLLTLGSLACFAVLYLGLLAILSRNGMFSLTLPGLAGMVLTTGSAADSSILVLERFHEEIRMGRTVRNASISGAKHGIRTSLDADIVTLVSAISLFALAIGTVKGFGLTLALGVACDIVTMFCFKAPALRLLARGTIQKNPKFWGIAEDLEEAEMKAHARGVKGGVAHA